MLKHLDIIPLDWTKFRLEGELGKRLEKAFARLIELRPGLFTSIQSYGMAEYAGNWLESMELLCRYYSGERENLFREVADELLTHQQEYGGFAQEQNPKTMNICFWVGDQRAVTGLLAAWRYFKDERYLQAAERVGKSLTKNWPTDMKKLALETWGGMLPLKPELYFSLAIHGMTQLYDATKDGSFLSFAEKVGKIIPRIEPDTYPEHADCRMNALFGILSLYKISGNTGLLDAAMKDQQVIANHFQWSSGGIPEIFPDNWRDEACQTANWVRVNLWLWKITGQERFLDTAERVWRNHLYFDQHPNGGFCWGRTLRDGGAKSQRPDNRGLPFEMYYCCSETAPRALLDIGRNAVLSIAGIPTICFWAAGQYILPGGKINIKNDLEPLKILRAECAFDQPVRLKIRIPQNMNPVALQNADGQKIPFLTDGIWMTVEAIGGINNLNLQLEGHVKLEEKSYPCLKPMTGDVNNSHAAWQKQDVLNFSDRRVPVFFGPWMLKADILENTWFEPNRQYENVFRGYVSRTGLNSQTTRAV